MLQSHVDVPFYAQTLPFTCGAACLLMLFKRTGQYLDSTAAQNAELELYQEATSIYMTSGHGGCGPRGIALAAHRRGLRPSIHVSHSGPLFIDSVRTAHKKAVLQRVYSRYDELCQQASIPISIAPVQFSDLELAISRGAGVMALISCWHLDGSKGPHWVVVTKITNDSVSFHDPYVNENEDPSIRQNYTVSRKIFAKMFCYGKNRLKAAIVFD
jgi:hypothetical protein